VNAVTSAFAVSVSCLLACDAVSARAADGDQERAQAYYFTVATADGSHDLGSWSKVSGLDVSWDIAEYRSGGAANVSRWYLPGNTKYGTVKLTRASSADIDLVLDWLRHVEATGESPSLVITLFDGAGEPVVRWELDAVFPRTFTIGGQASEGTDVAIETLVIAHEGFAVGCVRAC
jgi:phage tail-like protein